MLRHALIPIPPPNPSCASLSVRRTSGKLSEYQDTQSALYRLKPALKGTLQALPLYIAETFPTSNCPLVLATP